MRGAASGFIPARSLSGTMRFLPFCRRIADPERTQNYRVWDLIFGKIPMGRMTRWTIPTVVLATVAVAALFLPPGNGRAQAASFLSVQRVIPPITRIHVRVFRGERHSGIFAAGNEQRGNSRASYASGSRNFSAVSLQRGQQCRFDIFRDAAIPGVAVVFGEAVALTPLGVAAAALYPHLVFGPTSRSPPS